jgi:hypothetical protein
LECVHRFGENILYWLLTLAGNSTHARPNKFWRSQQLIYVSRRALSLPAYLVRSTTVSDPPATHGGATAGLLSADIVAKVDAERAPIENAQYENSV